MMNDDMLGNIEYLREKANVSYEEAAELLERFDGNVMRVLVELEHQGKVYTSANSNSNTKSNQQRNCSKEAEAAKQRAANFANKAFRTRIVVEKRDEDGEKQTVMNLSAPFALGVTVFAPYVTVASAVVAFATGHSVKIKKVRAEKTAS